MNIKDILTSTTHSVIFGTSLVINSRSRKVGPRTVREHFSSNIFIGIVFHFLEKYFQVRFRLNFCQKQYFFWRNSMMVTLAVSVLFRTCVKSYYIRLWNKSLLSYIYSLIFYIPRCKKVIYDRRCYGTTRRWPKNDRKGSERAFIGKTWYLKWVDDIYRFYHFIILFEIGLTEVIW